MGGMGGIDRGIGGGGGQSQLKPMLSMVMAVADPHGM